MPQEMFERHYQNAKSFRGYKRLYVTIFNDYDNSEANARALLQDKDYYMCIGHDITLTGLPLKDNRGICVFVDGHNLGTIWETNAGGPVFDATWNGAISGLSLRIEKSNPRPVVHLFVKCDQ